jgi:hypothetical protein
MPLYAYGIAATQSVLIGRQKASMEIDTYSHSKSFYFTVNFLWQSDGFHWRRDGIT